MYSVSTVNTGCHIERHLAEAGGYLLFSAANAPPTAVPLNIWQVIKFHGGLETVLHVEGTSVHVYSVEETLTIALKLSKLNLTFPEKERRVTVTRTSELISKSLSGSLFSLAILMS